MVILEQQVNPYDLLSSLDQQYLSNKSALQVVNKEKVGISVVQVDVGDVSFAVKVGVAVETILYKQPQILPRSHDWALGMIEVRGEVLPVIDFSILSNHTPSIVNKNSRLMIIRYEQLVFALLVSNVSAVSYVSEIHEGPHNGLDTFSWSKTDTDKWVNIQCKKIYLFDFKELLSQTNFLTLTY
jgi:two-component system chemotaxis response regulator CheV